MIFVTGANGMVGSYIREVFKGEELYETDIDTFDIRDPEAVMKEITRVKPDFVIHLAAKTDVDKSELEPDDAYLSNALGPQNIALACQRTGAIMVYVSTSAVFGGEKETPYTEFDQPAPVNIYGRAKWEGEKAVSYLLNRYYIVRAGWMIGGGQEKDRKFVGKMVQLFREKDKISAVNDKAGTLTYALELAKGIKALIKTGYYGLYHIASSGMCSRYDVAVEIGKVLGKKTPVEPVPSSVFPQPAPRARSEALDSYKLRLLGMTCTGTWQEALRQYLSTWHF